MYYTKILYTFWVIFVNVLEKLIFMESFHLYSYWILLDTWK